MPLFFEFGFIVFELSFSRFAFMFAATLVFGFSGFRQTKHLIHLTRIEVLAELVIEFLLQIYQLTLLGKTCLGRFLQLRV